MYIEPANSNVLLDDLKNLTETLLADTEGDRSRELVTYFETCALDSEQLRLRSEEPRERHLSELMRDAYQAGATILSATWSAMHSEPLR